MVSAGRRRSRSRAKRTTWSIITHHTAPQHRNEWSLERCSVQCLSIYIDSWPEDAGHPVVVHPRAAARKIAEFIDRACGHFSMCGSVPSWNRWTEREEGKHLPLLFPPRSLNLLPIKSMDHPTVVYRSHRTTYPPVLLFFLSFFQYILSFFATIYFNISPVYTTVYLRIYWKYLKFRCIITRVYQTKFNLVC